MSVCVSTSICVLFVKVSSFAIERWGQSRNFFLIWTSWTFRLRMKSPNLIHLVNQIICWAFVPHATVFLPRKLFFFQQAEQQIFFFTSTTNDCNLQCKWIFLYLFTLQILRFMFDEIFQQNVNLSIKKI